MARFAYRLASALLRLLTQAVHRFSKRLAQPIIPLGMYCFFKAQGLAIPLREYWSVYRTWRRAIDAPEEPEGV